MLLKRVMLLLDVTDLIRTGENLTEVGNTYQFSHVGKLKVELMKLGKISCMLTSDASLDEVKATCDESLGIASKLKRRLTARNRRFWALAIVLNNGNRPEPAVPAVEF